MSHTLSFMAFLVLSSVGALGQPPEGDVKPNRAEKIAAEIESQVAELRGLEFKSSTKIGIYKKPELREFLLGEMATEFKKADIFLQQIALAKMGLLAENLNVEKVMIDLLEEQIGGFYDPRRKELFLIEIADDDAEGAELEAMVMSHELVHALQDQHFDLTGLGLEDTTNDDVNYALRSLIEGDATLAMMLLAPGMKEVSKQQLAMVLGQFPDSLDGFKTLLSGGANLDLPGMGSVEQLMTAPRILTEPMIFQYMGGAKFCAKLWLNGGMKAIDAAFANPPLSTEQILHPEKYQGEGRDLPQTVTVAKDALGEGWKPVYSNTLGELQIRVLLSELAVKRLKARRAHRGWDGDRYVLFANGDDHALVSYSTWDSPDDAEEFASIIGAAIAKATGLEQNGRRIGDRYVIGHKGSDVAVLIDAKGDVDATIDRLFATTKKSEVVPKGQKKSEDGGK